jgi:MFS family permease
MPVTSTRSLEHGQRRVWQLPRHVIVLGIISFLTAMSSAMVYGLLPIFLVKVLQATAASVGIIEGIAEGATSLTKIASGLVSDRIGRRKPLVFLGYALSALNKLIFPIADAVSTILVARVVDRIGKGMRDAPRDAFLTDVTPAPIRGSGFGLRLAFYTVGFVIGPLTAVSLMILSGDNFRLVFWVAVVPAVLAIVVLLVALKEAPKPVAAAPSLRIRVRDLKRFSTPFWWAIAIASLLSLARFSQAFLILKANSIGIDAAFVPFMLVLMHAVYAAAAYPCGVLSDRVDHRRQLAVGAVILVCADSILASADSVWMAALGASLWGFQLAVTQGLLSAAVANAAPDALRGTGFGIYELAVGIATFVASAGAGALWMVGGPGLAFAVSAAIAAATIPLLSLQPGRPPAARAAVSDVDDFPA